MEKCTGNYDWEWGIGHRELGIGHRELGIGESDVSFYMNFIGINISIDNDLITNQNRKYRCAIGKTVAGSQINNSPPALTS